MRKTGELITKRHVDVSDVDMSKLEIQPKHEQPKPVVFDPDNIPGCNYEKVLEWLEANKREDGSIVMFDEIGTCEKWKETERGGIAPDDSTRTHLALVTSWQVSEGVNAGGTYKRVTVSRNGFLSIVCIKKGQATVGQAWMPATKAA